MRAMKLAMMAKLGRCILREKDSLWSQILTSKYMRGPVGMGPGVVD